MKDSLDADGIIKKTMDALRNLLTYAEQNTCTHESTHRGGAIWTICDDCGEKWADDEGGKPRYKEPIEFTRARRAYRQANLFLCKNNRCKNRIGK